MNNKQKVVLAFHGFTLVEMLIVMAIIGALLALVGPLAIDSLSKAQARAEVLSIRNWLNYQGKRAFITGNKTQVHFKGKVATLVVGDSSKLIESKQFNYLFFQPQKVIFNNHGISNASQVIATTPQKNIIIELDDWRGTRVNNK